LKLLWIAFGAVVALGCGTTVPATPKKVDSGTPDGGAVPPALLPGEVCTPCTAQGCSTSLVLRFDPATVVVAPGKSRPVLVSVEPDLCSPLTLSLKMGDSKIATAPSQGPVDLRHASYSFDLVGVANGKTTLTASLQRVGDTAPTTVQLPIVVQSGAPATCKTGDQTNGTLNAASPALEGTASIAGASLSVPAAAFTRTDEFGMPTFPAQIACPGDDLTKATSGHPAAAGSLVAISPAVTFTAGAPISMTESLRRELDFTIPVNPAAIPPGGRLRHMELLFMSPGGHGVMRTPHAITIASPRIDATSTGYVAHFSSPWFGTYQVVYPSDAGTVRQTRHLTHRGVMGISMGGGGAATFGMRHHDQFDVIEPLGAAMSDWTWFLWFIKTYYIAGFCPQTDPLYPNCKTYAPNLYPLPETYAHTGDFNHWFSQPGSGNGGTWGRGELSQVLDDFALALGNPNGQNADPSLEFFPAGPTSSDLWVKGQVTTPPLPSGVDCRVTVDPLSCNPGDPPSCMQAYTNEQAWQTQCLTSRCSNLWQAKTGYYDREYNPDGSLPVLTYCEGGENPTDPGSPYVDTWAPLPSPSQGTPLDVAMFVDQNGNGMRDVNEPILRQGYEPWNDTGTDGLFDVDEPGYDPIKNPDPNQDDYDYQLNPNGTEYNHRYDVGESFQDFGLDGVKGTKQQSEGGFDIGEGDGKFTMSHGLQNFYAVDAHSILHQWSTAIPAGPMTDSEMLRISFWADGGVRDQFNLGADTNHFEGAVASRLKADGTQLRTTAYYNGFDKLPGQVPGNENAFTIYNMTWADLVQAPYIRYGTLDATPAMIAAGDGQHVGTAAQAIDRVISSLFFAGKQWIDADHTLSMLASEDPETSTKNVLGKECEIGGSCTTNFTGPITGRTGPIIVGLPPGYALAENAKRDVRYPVVFALHGYGMTPQDFQALAIASTNFMNDASKSSATRLAKFIMVYVDGRCRVQEDGWPECIHGTFWLDSDRPHGARMDSWFNEVVTYIDQNYRTMPASDVDILE
jgi:hypothetical protein